MIHLIHPTPFQRLPLMYTPETPMNSQNRDNSYEQSTTIQSLPKFSRIVIKDLGIDLPINPNLVNELQNKKLSDKQVVNFAKLCVEYGDKEQFGKILEVFITRVAENHPTLTGEKFYQKVEQAYLKDGLTPLYKKYRKKVDPQSYEIAEKVKKYPSLSFLRKGKAPVTSATTPPKNSSGFKPLGNPTDRRLMHLITLSGTSQEEYEQIPGVKIISKKSSEVTFNGLTFPMQCDSYLFHNEPWFSDYMKEAATNKNIRFFFKPEGLHAFMRFGNYQNIPKPKVGAIVVYLTQEGKVVHFAKITSVENEENFTVRSKFGAGFIFEHPFKLVPHYYGDFYAIFDKVPESSISQSILMAATTITLLASALIFYMYRNQL